jgi:hypothetical protein
VRLAGAAKCTNKVVEAVCVIVPAVPVMVSERAYGVAFVVVFIVSVDDPEAVIVDGLSPPLVMPLGNPFSLPTLRVTAPLNPLTDETVTVKFADWPGMTSCEEGLTSIEKSALVGSTVIIRVGGLGSELPLLSLTVSDATYSPGVLKTTFPGFLSVEVRGEPPGKTQEYLAALEVVLKETMLPAAIVMSEVGEVIVPLGGVVEYGESWINCATDGTPVLSSRNNM